MTCFNANPMDPFQLKQALTEVRDLRKHILEKQLYRGYSGRARAIGGTIALVVAAVASCPPLQPGPDGLFLTWGGVFLAALAVNYGALAIWMLKGNFRRSDHSVVFEMLPVWLVGGGITLALWRLGQHDLLYGSWMCLFGLAQSLHRLRLPRKIARVGAWYIGCGMLCLLFADGIFERPLAMGLVFFIGEFAAGFILHNSHHGHGVAGFLKMEGQTDA